MWSGDSDRTLLLSLLPLEHLRLLLSWPQKGRRAPTEKRCAILKLWFPSKLLTQWIHQAKLWPLWDIAASKVSVSCFLCFAEDSQSYCNLQSCRPGPSTGTLCGYFVLWWFCKKYQGKSIICGGRADSLTLPMDSRAPKSTGQHI